MKDSSSVEDLLTRISEEHENDRSACDADEKCQKIYDRIRELNKEKEELKSALSEMEDPKEKLKLEVQIHHLEKDINTLLDVLSADSMQF
jgi:predicted RNase H-like nuclease (RuvC/YqgF family)